MAVAKKYPVKVKVPASFLAALPPFATSPKPKRVKKLADEKKAALATPALNGISPAPEEGSVAPPPVKESTGTILLVASAPLLDKSGTPTRRWVRGTRQFKSFSGFKLRLKIWKPKADKQEDDVPEIEVLSPIKPEAPPLSV